MSAGGPGTRPRGIPIWAMVLPAALLLASIAGGWVFWTSPPSRPQAAHQVAAPSTTARTTEPASPAPPAATATVPQASAPIATSQPATAAPVPAPFQFVVADEQQVRDHVPTAAAPALTIFRFAPNTRILILDFTSLRDQGRMLNRIAAFGEKSGLPHDRVLTDVELDTAIRAGGDTPETFYYGHDYSAQTLVRFFKTADRDNIRLLGDEEELRRLITREGWFEPNARGGLISIPQIGADEHVTREARATILHHELSHGEYFTNPGYVTFVHHFWTQILTGGERDRIRGHLRTLGYDSSLEEVMENEAQAYLMFTDGPEFFTPEMIGMSKARLAEVRNLFFRGMPPGWLRDSLGRSQIAEKADATERH